MADEITPALTAEEWADTRAELAKHHPAYAADVVAYPRRTMALGNAALPDGHAGKITHVDVNALRFAAEALRAAGARLMAVGISDGIQQAQAETVDRLAVKLAALLPPRAEM